jgi:hypothetical protein
MEEKNLKETLAYIAANIEELKDKKKVKRWNLPFIARLGMGKKKKQQGYVVFVNLGTNKAATFIKAPITDGVALVNDIPHVVHPEDIFLWKNKIPLVFQPQWSERPFSAREHFNDTNDKGQNSLGWEYIMNFILKTQIKEKKQVKMGFLILIGIIVLGGGYYLIKSGALS